MTPLRLLLVICFFLVASVPWFYVGASSVSDEGLPNWALHGFVSMFLFAIFIAYALKKYWALMAGDEDNPQIEKENNDG